MRIEVVTGDVLRRWRRRLVVGYLVACPMAAAGTPAGAATLSGTVTDERGQPIAGVDLDFIVVATGQEEATNCIPENCAPGFACGDDTDLAGTYCATVKSEIYDVRYTPLQGSRYAAHVERSVNLTAHQTLAIVLRDAWIVSGTVLRADTGRPAVNVDLDFRDLQTRRRLFTPFDDTDAAGHYAVAVPIGIYEVSFEGPVLLGEETRLAPARLEEVSVTGESDVTLATVTLVPGFAVAGDVQDEKGDAVTGTDIEFISTLTGVRVYAVGDTTDARGLYQAVVPGGAYKLEFDPPPGSLSAAKFRENVVIDADTGLGRDVLPDGWLLSGFVRDPDGIGLPRVDLGFHDSATGSSVPAAHDDSDAGGLYAVRVPTGTYDIDFQPQANSLVLPALRTAETVAFDRTLPDTVLPFQDADGDGTPDVRDLCPFVADAGQSDADGDGAGDVCDRCAQDADPRQEDNDGDGAGDACDPDDDDDGIADPLDLDQDGDGLPYDADNCPGARNPGQQDRDADGLGDACDPDDGEVEGLEARGSSGFTWRPEIGATVYQAYRQRRGWLSAINYGTCFQDDLRGRLFHDPEVPAAGEAFLYLVTMRAATGEGTLGRRGDGDDRPNLRPCP